MTKQVKIIDKKSFAKVVLDRDSETFVVYVAALEALKLTIHLSKAVQVISGNLM